MSQQPNEPGQGPCIVCFGPGPQFKGGIAQYNTALAKALARQGARVHIVSWTQQYPALIPRDFVDRSSTTNFLEGTQIPVTARTDYNRPGTWAETCRYIASLQPQTIILQWSIAIQGIPMGWMARRLRAMTQAEILFDVHVLVQKEASLIDAFCTRYGLWHAHSYIVHAHKTAQELQATLPKPPYTLTETGQRTPGGNTRHILKLYHPVYDLFAPNPALDIEAEKAALGLKKHVFLFFGFIRKYKGLHNVIPAFAALRRQREDVSLLIVGESFWNTLDQRKWQTRLKNALFGMAKRALVRNSDDERDYNPLALIQTLQVPDVVVVNRFVPNEDVHRYFQVSDASLNFYLTATPSGVESLAYNFRLPVLATRVGHFPETIREGVNGYLAEPEDIPSMTAVMARSIEAPIDRARVAQAAAWMSWDNYARAILAPQTP